ncbi:hypothetical protein COV18_01595 [Candidatus Woesearchaeota archaeon CG10_big_fil_rev_8_21_14_0_10_37_12]|nr:MAG: hypothetical protein COV18_01595 [Candidatus Woesearchaeota archaeon CG10_big_fil_rev_8_21_14_0_10_37_12]
MQRLKDLVNRVVPEGPFKEVLRYVHHRATRNGGIDVAYDLGKSCYRVTFPDGPLQGQQVLFPRESIVPLLGMGVEIPPYFTKPFAEGALVIDAGAYPGEFAVLASRMVGSGVVVALEPDPVNRAYLQKVLDLNGVDVASLELALSDGVGKKQLVLNGVESQIVNPDYRRNGSELVDVRTITLDSLTAEARTASKPIVVKMDIEGHELEAFRGASETIAYGAQFIVAAYHRVAGEQTYCALSSLLREEGYKVELVNQPHVTLIARKS